jgi:hypothetical protein
LLVTSGKSKCARYVARQASTGAPAHLCVTDRKVGRPGTPPAASLGAVMRPKPQGDRRRRCRDQRTPCPSPRTSFARATAFARTVLDDPQTTNMSAWNRRGYQVCQSRQCRNLTTRTPPARHVASADLLSGQRIAELAPPGGKMLPAWRAA